MAAAAIGTTREQVNIREVARAARVRREEVLEAWLDLEEFFGAASEKYAGPVGLYVGAKGAVLAVGMSSDLAGCEELAVVLRDTTAENGRYCTPYARRGLPAFISRVRRDFAHCWLTFKVVLVADVDLALGDSNDVEMFHDIDAWRGACCYALVDGGRDGLVLRSEVSRLLPLIKAFPWPASGPSVIWLKGADPRVTAQARHEADERLARELLPAMRAFGLLGAPD